MVCCESQTSQGQGLSFCTLHFALCTKLVPEVGIAPTSPPLQGGANLPQLLGVVVPRGNAPRSSGYQPGALLLSYRTVLISGFNPNPTGRNTKVTFGAKRIRMIRFGLKPLRTGNLP